MLGIVVLVAGLPPVLEKANDTAALDSLTAEQLYKRGELALQVKRGKNEDALATSKRSSGCIYSEGPSADHEAFTSTRTRNTKKSALRPALS